MKKTMLFFSALATFSFANAQTYVGGGINANTTWTKTGSPYIVTSNVTVFQNDTLTIQPGVTVKFYPQQLLYAPAGSIIAIGTPTDSIIFTSNSPNPKAGAWAGVLGGTVYNYCSFSYADTALDAQTIRTYQITHCSFISNHIGLFMAHTITDSCYFAFDTVGSENANRPIIYSTFMHDGTGILGLIQASINNSIFSYNNYGIRCIPLNSTIGSCLAEHNKVYGIYVSHTNIQGCNIIDNGIGISDEDGNVSSCIISNNNIGIIFNENETYNCNSICNNSLYNVEMMWNFNRSLANNYWCLTDSASIGQTIYDGRVNPSLGLLVFTPFDTVVCDTMVPLLSVPSISSTVSDFSLYPNPTTSIITVTLKQSADGTAILTNVLGQELYRTHVKANSGNTFTLNLNNMQQGVYFLRIESSGQVLTKKVFKI